MQSFYKGKTHENYYNHHFFILNFTHFSNYCYICIQLSFTPYH